MKFRYFIFIVCGAACGFFVGRMIPLSPASDETNEKAQPQVEKLSALRSQLGNKGRSFKDDSWAEVLSLADSAEGSEDWIALLQAARHDSFLMRAIVRRWAAQDAAGCWEYILTLGDGILPPRHLANIVAKAWGHRTQRQRLSTWPR